MDPVSLIERKRDGRKLSLEEIDFLIQGYTEGRIPDYQVSAFLMAVYLRGMDASETAALTWSMIESGKRIKFENLAAIPADKHSTGGVGDKITLSLVPLVASCGVPVPMLSGRSLRHSGGTLDKLESIPGFRTNLSLEEFRTGVETVGAVIMGQTGELAPSDRKIYALRDVTATVPSLPLITASILSKKVVGGAKALVLDVKCGAGAFMASREEARALGHSLKQIGADLGLKISGFITNMDQPLGRAVGNSMEVKEAIDILRGEGPPDTTELTVLLASEMLHLAGAVRSREEGKRRIEDVIESGAGVEKFKEMIAYQGGDPRVVDDPGLLPKAAQVHEFKSPSTGFITRWDARLVGLASMDLGAGRIRMTDRTDPAVGIELLKKVGDRVGEGETLGRIHSRTGEDVPAALRKLEDGVRISDQQPSPEPLVLESM